jgi:hypothetical protein
MEICDWAQKGSNKGGEIHFSFYLFFEALHINSSLQ